MSSVRRALLASLVALTACAGSSIHREPPVDAAHAGFRLWFDGGAWHVRTSPDRHSHRFQGSVTAVGGSISRLALTDPSLTDRAALVDGAVQFDFEGTTNGGFDATVPDGCARFDLLLDGKHRPERVHLGAAAKTPHAVPFEHCAK